MSNFVEEFHALLAEHDKIIHLSTRFAAIKHPNFGLKEREPLQNALADALKQNIEDFKKLSLKVKDA